MPPTPLTIVDWFFFAIAVVLGGAVILSAACIMTSIAIVAIYKLYCKQPEREIKNEQK